ncbi:MAG: DUF4190 domain-containing protein [Mycobacterium sp.]|nr:MAG: DUF4190 domain-containing protein [Mycobacterium sp.]
MNSCARLVGMTSPGGQSGQPSWDPSGPADSAPRPTGTDAEATSDYPVYEYPATEDPGPTSAPWQQGPPAPMPPGFLPPAGYLPPPLYSSYPAPRSSDGMAIGSLVSSLIALPLYFICFVFGPAGSLLGIILGVVALAQSKGRPQTNGRNMAIAGIVIGAITLIVGLVGFVVLVDWASRQDPTL